MPASPKNLESFVNSGCGFYFWGFDGNCAFSVKANWRRKKTRTGLYATDRGQAFSAKMSTYSFLNTYDTIKQHTNTDINFARFFWTSFRQSTILQKTWFNFLDFSFFPFTFLIFRGHFENNAISTEHWLLFAFFLQLWPLVDFCWVFFSKFAKSLSFELFWAILSYL